MATIKMRTRTESLETIDDWQKAEDITFRVYRILCPVVLCRSADLILILILLHVT
jgi:hypothetical protein